MIERMSRFYTWRGDILIRRPEREVHDRTGAWLASRQRRSQRRTGQPEQPRTEDGFILRPGADGTYLHDPGVIDRHLWTKARQVEEAGTS